MHAVERILKDIERQAHTDEGVAAYDLEIVTRGGRKIRGALKAVKEHAYLILTEHHLAYVDMIRTPEKDHYQDVYLWLDAIEEVRPLWL
jgi:small nuclear ribonucleoprotein (snRNP)-like protein